MTGERLTTPPHWVELLETAFRLEGASGGTYCRFRNLSLANQALLMMQTQIVEPMQTYKGWLGLNRQVKKGSRAKSIYVPMFRKDRDEKGAVVEEVLTGFKLVPCMFGYSETEGEELPPWQPPTWSKERALEKLDITEVPYSMTDLNVQGFSLDRTIAINPLARYPFKTLAHEISHVVHGHTTGESTVDYQTHRGIAEFQAEATAYLVLNELDATGQFDPSESRYYIFSWLRGQTPPDAAIKQVFSVADKIIRAGRLEVNAELAEAS